MFSATAGALRLGEAPSARHISATDLRVAPSHGSAPTRIFLSDGSLCELPNSSQTDLLLAQLGIREGLVDALQRRSLAVGAMLAVFVALMAAVYAWGIPLATDLLADHLPAAWESDLGQGVLRQLESGGVFRNSQLDGSRQEAIRAAFAELTRTDAQPAYRIEFRRMGVPNAFTLPGGTIVVGDELVQLAGDDRDALLTVLAHELGHVRYRHGVRNLVHASLVSAWMAWYIGDVSSLVVTAGAGFADLHYSRAAETQADQYAWHFMHGRGISTQGAAELFERLARWRPAGAPQQPSTGAAGASIPTYLSTHPDIGARIALFASGGGKRRAP